MMIYCPMESVIGVHIALAEKALEDGDLNIAEFLLRELNCFLDNVERHRNGTGCIVCGAVIEFSEWLCNKCEDKNIQYAAKSAEELGY